jgi:hypothetical protein
MHERQAASCRLYDHLVSEYGSGRNAAELLDVRAAEPTREHLERRAGLGQFRETRPAVRV